MYILIYFGIGLLIMLIEYAVLLILRYKYHEAFIDRVWLICYVSLIVAWPGVIIRLILGGISKEYRERIFKRTYKMFKKVES